MLRCSLYFISPMTPVTLLGTSVDYMSSDYEYDTDESEVELSSTVDVPLGFGLPTFARDFGVLNSPAHRSVPPHDPIPTGQTYDVSQLPQLSDMLSSPSVPLEEVVNTCHLADADTRMQLEVPPPPIAKSRRRLDPQSASIPFAERPLTPQPVSGSSVVNDCVAVSDVFAHDPGYQALHSPRRTVKRRKQTRKAVSLFFTDYRCGGRLTNNSASEPLAEPAGSE